MSTTRLITQDGRFEVIESRWDHNGSHQVQVIEHRTNASEYILPGAIHIDRSRIRSLARKVDPMPELIRWVRIDRTVPVDTPDGQRMTYHLTVSRLDPLHR